MPQNYQPNQELSGTLGVSGAQGLTVTISGSLFSQSGQADYLTITDQNGTVIPPLTGNVTQTFNFTGAQIRVRFRSSNSFSSRQGYGATINVSSYGATAAVTLPNAFSFSPVTGAVAGYTSISNSITVLGTNAPSPISLTAGSYRINSGPWTSQSGYVLLGDLVQVSVFNALASGGVTNATLSIGGRSATFTVTTRDTTPNQFGFPEVFSAPLGTPVESECVPIDGISAIAPIQIFDGDYQLGCTGPFTNQLGGISNNQTVRVRHTTASTPATSIQTRLVVGDFTGFFKSTTAAPPVCSPKVAPATPVVGNLVTLSANCTNSPSSWAWSSASAPALSSPTSATPTATFTAAGTFTYSVVATNAIGSSAAQQVQIVVSATVPGAPTIGNATAGNGQASVAFNAPLADGGSAITGYTATCGSQSLSGSLSPITVTPLANGVAVACTVKASNAIGLSAASALSNSVTPFAPATVPGAPIIGTATAGNELVMISFTAPANNGGSAITGYIAFCGGQSGGGTNSPITVAGLTNGVTVTCTVKATNAVGIGIASAASNSVTPTAPVSPVNGTCGSANGTIIAVAPAPNLLCATGTASSVVGTGPWTWTCAGVNGGSNSSCSAQLADTTPDAYAFAAQSDVALSSILTSNAVTISGINSAAAIAVLSGTYSIGCNGVFTSSSGTISNGQTVCVRQTSAATYNTLVQTALCVGSYCANFDSTTIAAPTAINGSCGSANGSLLASAPSSGLCSVGTAGPVTGSGPWSWTCSGSNGGSNASCSAQLAANTYTLTVNAGAGGATTPVGSTQRTVGESITVTATPNSGFGFANWTGYAGCGASASCTFAMPSTAVTLTANFTATPACTYSFNPTSLATLGPAAVSGAFAVVTQSGCAIAAPVVSATGGWLTASSSGSTVNFTVTQNTNSASRTGTITVGTLVMSITQGSAGVAGSCGLGYPLGNWRTFGTAAMSGDTLTIGDNIGNDPGDRDGDCNPEAYLFPASASSAVDSEWAVYSQSYTQPISFSWSGCIGSTELSVMGVGLGFVNPLFTGAQNSNQFPIGQWDVVFMTRYDRPGKLFVYSTESGALVGSEVTAATSSTAGMCGSFEVRSGGGRASAYFNGSQVYLAASPSASARVPYVRSYDKPVTVVNAAVGAMPLTDTTPDPFSFVAQTGVPGSSTRTSEAVTITGIDTATLISVANGLYSIGCTSVFKSTADTITNGQTVCARHTSPSAYSTTTSTTLTVGGVSAVFSSTTVAAPPPPDCSALTLTPQFQNFSSAGGSGSITIAPAGCGASLPTLPSWMSMVSFGFSGPNASLVFNVAANALPTARTAAITLRSTGPVGFTPVDYMATVSQDGIASNGACGTSNGGVFGAAPTVGLCSTGTASPITGAGPWSWTCSGSYGGTNASCSAQLIDTTPDAFSFVAQSAVALTVPVTSNTITITGINSPGPISIAGGSYSIGCNGTFTSAAATISNGQNVCLKHTSASNNGTAVTTVLTVGGVVGTFTSTTVAAPVCNYSISPTSQYFPVEGGVGVITISPPSCSWSLPSLPAWISLVSTSSSPNTLTYQVAANNTGSARVGTITIQGQVATISQASSAVAGQPDAALSASGANGGLPTCGPAASDVYVHWVWNAQPPGKVIAHTADGKYVTIGYNQCAATLAAYRYTAAGALDSTFGAGGIVSLGINRPDPRDVGVQSSGRTLVMLYGDLDASSLGAFLVGLTPAGVIDTSFGDGGRVALPFNSHSGLMVIGADDKIHMVGNTSTPNSSPLVYLRLLSSGLPDTSVVGSGTTLGAHALVLPSNNVERISAPKLVSNSTLGDGLMFALQDSTFCPEGSANYFIGPRPMFLKFAASGVTTVAPGGANSSGGAWWCGFPQPAQATNLTPSGSDVSPDGQLYLQMSAPTSFDDPAGASTYVYRFNADMTIDATWGTSGRLALPAFPGQFAAAGTTFDTTGIGLKVYPDGRIVSAVREGRSGDFFYTTTLAGLLPTGAVDTAFGAGGTTRFESLITQGLDAQDDGRIVVASFKNLWRFLSYPSASPSTLSFKTIAPGANNVQGIKISNTAPPTLTITGAVVPAPYTVVGSSCPTQLVPGASCTLSVMFAPTAAGNYLSTLAITTSGRALSVQLRGVSEAFKTCSLDISGDGGTFAQTDGVLLTRYLLGFRGAALVDGVALSASRPDAASIESFMGNASAFDIVGRSVAAPTAFVDGLILLRLLQGVPDNALLNGITVPASAAFKDAAAIRANVNARCGTAF